MLDSLRGYFSKRKIEVLLKIVMVLGGAWLIFGAFSFLSMEVLNQTAVDSTSSGFGFENLHFKFVVDTLIEFLFQMLIALTLIVSAFFGNNRLWNVTGFYSVLYFLYSIYDYLRSVKFFQNYIFSFDGKVDLFIKVFYFFQLISVVFVCFYCGYLFRNIIYRTFTLVLVFAGSSYLVYAIILSVLKMGSSISAEFVSSIRYLIVFGSLYAFGLFYGEHSFETPSSESKRYVEDDNVEPMNIKEITTIIDNVETDVNLNDNYAEIYVDQISKGVSGEGDSQEETTSIYDDLYFNIDDALKEIHDSVVDFESFEILPDEKN